MVGGVLFFAANDGTNGLDLSRSNGVDTVMVKDIPAGSDGSLPNELTAVDGTL